jgi:hypothetical protein
MDFFITVCIFVVLFFIYVHIIDHYKKSEDMEIYEMDYTNGEQLQEVCKVKQPTLFEFQSIFPRFYEAVTLDKILDKSGDRDQTSVVQVKDTTEYRLLPPIDTIDPVPLSFASYFTLSNTDSRSHYITQDNGPFIETAGLLSSIEDVDEFFKPDYTVHREYDLLMGSKGAYTPMQYHTHYRRFVVVASGKLQVKMTPWRNSKYMHPVVDYENYEFRGAADVWLPQPQMTGDIEHTPFLECDVQEGFVLYVPPYWWYSIRYDTAATLAITATYDSTMSVLANAPDLTKYWIQQQNIREKVVRTFVASSTEKGRKEEEVDENEADQSDAEEFETNSLLEMNEEGEGEIEMFENGEPATASASELVEHLADVNSGD